jgi:hypothetical protein
MTVLYALLLAHFLSDFVLQSDRLVDAKKELKILPYLKHGGIVATSTLLLTWLAGGPANLRIYVELALAVALVHVLQDGLKDLLRSRLLSGAHLHISRMPCSWLASSAAPWAALGGCHPARRGHLGNWHRPSGGAETSHTHSSDCAHRRRRNRNPTDGVCGRCGCRRDRSIPRGGIHPHLILDRHR